MEVLRRRVAVALTRPDTGSGALLRGITILAVLVSAGMAQAMSLGDIRDHLVNDEHWVVLICSCLFGLEFGLRLWAAPEIDENGQVDHEPGQRSTYLLSFIGVVDLLCWTPVILLPAIGTGDWLAVLQMIPLFKLGRYIPGLELVGTVLRNESRLLLATLSSLTVLVPVMSTLVYVCEHDAQPEVFRSIPHALWWGIVTMTTSGYGDMVPVTLPGRALAGLAMLVGIAMLAMPVGIIANGFANEVRRRELLANYRLVSSLPLFRDLDAHCIADIASLLRPQVMPARSAVLTRGEIASSMYFIIEGEVEVQVAAEPVLLGPGEFFGEGALIENRPRKATIRTRKTCRFLVLELTDFHALTERQPEILKRIRTVSDTRN